jgi:signal peptidase I
VRKLLSLLVIATVAATSACGSEPDTEQFTQGGVSMEPTVKSGQVITATTVEGEYEPHRGDVVLFHVDDEKWGTATGAPLLKRVVAVGGERVACCDPAGRLTVDGRPLDEPYVVKNSSPNEPATPQSCASRRFAEVAVAPGTLFVLGDNRAASVDSRCAGTIPASSVFAVMTG